MYIEVVFVKKLENGELVFVFLKIAEIDFLIS
jgi:hypothetical protein